METNEPLTTFDIKILDWLQKDASMSTSELAEKIGLSQSPCWRRVQRLKDEGYIKRQVAILDREKFGPSLTVFTYLKMSTLTDDKRAEFLRKVDAIPEILECYSLFGERDIMLKVVASGLDWYHKFIFSTLLKLPGVLDAQSTVSLTELKNSTAIPLNGLRPA